MIEQPQIYADDLLDGLQGEPVRGASSTEDFWMFFSFAMILLVFVLRNYVSYLYSMVVKPPDQIATIDVADVADADVADKACAATGAPEADACGVSASSITDGVGAPVPTSPQDQTVPTSVLL